MCKWDPKYLRESIESIFTKFNAIVRNNSKTKRQQLRLRPLIFRSSNKMLPYCGGLHLPALRRRWSPWPDPGAAVWLVELLCLSSDLWCPYLWSRLVSAAMWLKLMHMYIYIPAHCVCDVFKLGLCSCSSLNECFFQVLILLMQRKYTRLCHNNRVTICHSII